MPVDSLQILPPSKSLGEEAWCFLWTFSNRTVLAEDLFVGHYGVGLWVGGSQLKWDPFPCLWCFNGCPWVGLYKFEMVRNCSCNALKEDRSDLRHDFDDLVPSNTVVPSNTFFSTFCVGFCSSCGPSSEIMLEILLVAFMASCTSNLLLLCFLCAKRDGQEAQKNVDQNSCNELFFFPKGEAYHSPTCSFVKKDKKKSPRNWGLVNIAGHCLSSESLSDASETKCLCVVWPNFC